MCTLFPSKTVSTIILSSQVDVKLLISAWGGTDRSVDDGRCRPLPFAELGFCRGNFGWSEKHQPANWQWACLKNGVQLLKTYRSDRVDKENTKRSYRRQKLKLHEPAKPSPQKSAHPTGYYRGWLPDLMMRCQGLVFFLSLLSKQQCHFLETRDFAVHQIIILEFLSKVPDFFWGE